MILTLQPPDATLSPPLALRDSAQILRDIISVYDSSLVDAEVPKAGLKAGATSNGDGDDTHADDSFMTLLGKAIDPAVEMCERMAEMRGGDMWDRDVFLINCLGYLQVSPIFTFHLTALEMEWLALPLHFCSSILDL